MTAEQSAGTRTRIPRFRTREEAAEFWDAHDFTEFEDEWRPARLKVAKELRHVLAVPLPREVLTQLIETSRARGVGVTALAAQLIADGLGRPSVEPVPASSRKD